MSLSAAAPPVLPPSLVEQRLVQLRALLKIAQEQIFWISAASHASSLSDPAGIMSTMQLNETNQIAGTFMVSAAEGKTQQTTLVIGLTCIQRGKDEIAYVVHCSCLHASGIDAC
jgi:hypothetical protein